MESIPSVCFNTKGINAPRKATDSDTGCVNVQLLLPVLHDPIESIDSVLYPRGVWVLRCQAIVYSYYDTFGSYAHRSVSHSRNGDLKTHRRSCAYKMMSHLRYSQASIRLYEVISRESAQG